MNHLQESACHYLFGKEAAEIYGKKIPEEIVNQSLETLMKANIAFLSRKDDDGFPFIDPAAFNNQCHLYSLLAARIKKNYKEKTAEEKLAKTQENRFLHLSFLLSYTFLTDRRLLCQTIERAASKGEISLPISKEHFDDFVKDNQGFLIRTARLSLNEVFERSMKKILEDAKGRSLLHKELYELSLEDLRVLPDRGKEKLYTLPKLVGVAYLIEENISFVIKTKVINEKGTGILFFKSGNIQGDDPVLIFETVASDKFSIKEFRNIAQECPTYFERKASSKDRHFENKNCHYCNPEKIDLGHYQGSFEKATASMQETLYALGADFMQEVQPAFLKFFKDEKKYPLLADIFKKAIPNIEKLGLSMKKPLAFTVDHVYVDSAKHALSSEFRMNMSPESFLQTRGFL